MATVEALGGPAGGDPLGALEACEQEGVGDGLGVRVGELGVVGVREEGFPELLGELMDGRSLPAYGGQDIVTEEAAEGSQRLGQGPRGLGRDRVPGEKVVKQVAERRYRVVEEGARAFLDQVFRDDLDRTALALTAPVEGPLQAVGVNQIGQRLELLPLLPVGALELFGAGALPRGLELHISGEQLPHLHADVRPCPQPLHLGLGAARDLLFREGAGAFEQLPNRSLELVLRLGLDA